ncbi:MAG: filamentous hemagglutinin N-terminal domain-containing protein [Thalassolituus sp.]|uniref:filamentous hemagglutinin N-terminal domain-containing protein n=1 Tax=Thalassolituus sp. TaxID=2030822 RepID=UPI00398199E9
MTKNTNTSKNVTTAATGFLPKLKQLAEAIRNANLIAAGIRGSLLGSLIAGQIVMPVAVLAADLPQQSQSDPFAGINIDGSKMTINQGDSNRIAITWDSFDISKDYTVEFVQPSTGVALNQVAASSNSASNIAGTLKANATVILVNPNGIVFTSKATVNVGSLIASGLDVSVLDTDASNLDDFIKGSSDTLQFSYDSNKVASVVNLGVISATSTILLGRSVTNSGTIKNEDNLGFTIHADVVDLVGANGATVRFDGDGLLGISVGAGLTGLNNSTSTIVLNEGTIKGKSILLQASVAEALLASAVNNSGVIEAGGISTNGDQIRLVGINTSDSDSAGASISNSGKITANNGASISFEADSVLLDSGTGISSTKTINVTADELNVSGASSDYNDFDLLADVDSKSEDNKLNINITGSYSDMVVTGVTTVVASGATINGTDAVGETFTVASTNAVGVNGIDFTGVSTVVAGTATDIIDIVNAGGDGAQLNGANNELIASDITFEEVEKADLANGTLVGKDDVNEAFSIDSDGITVGVNSMILTSVSAIDAGTSSGDSVTFGVATSASLVDENKITDPGVEELVAIDNSLSTTHIDFSNINSADLKGGVLTGSDGADTFVVNTGGLKANEIAVTGLALNTDGFATIDAGGNASGADKLTSDFDATLTGASKALTSSGFTFQNIETADLNTKALTGSDSADTFVLATVDNATQLKANDIVFNNIISTIDAGDNDTGLDKLTSDFDATLTGASKALTSSNFTFQNIESADLNTKKLTGTDASETFTFTDANTFNVNDISFTDVATVVAGGADSVVDTVKTAGNKAELTGASNELKVSGITFQSIDVADLAGVNESGEVSNGSLSGSSKADTFVLATVESNTQLKANGIVVNNSNTTIDADTNGMGSDKLTSDFDATLAGASKALISNGFTFQNIETADLNKNALKGSDSADTFVLATVDNVTQLKANDIVFEDLNTTIDAGTNGTGSDKLTSDFDATLTGASKALTSSGFTFQNIETADLNTKALTGSDSADTFVLATVDNATQLKANDIVFEDINTTINASGNTGGNDKLTSDFDASLTSENNEVSSSDYLFQGIEETVLADGTLTGTAAAETFTVAGSKAVGVNAIDFTGVTTVVAGTATTATDVTDTVDTDGTDAALDVANNQLVASDITFKEIEKADFAGDNANGTLTGSANSDSFVVNADGLKANEIVVTGLKTNADGIATINALGNAAGVDKLTSTFDASLTSENNEVSSSGYLFQGIEETVLADGTLTGTAAAETFTVAGSKAVGVNGIDFKGVTTVVAGTATDVTDTVDTDGTAAALNGNNNELVVSDITFKEIESADLASTTIKGTLTGTEEAEDFFVGSSVNELVVNAINFTGVDTVVAGTKSGAIDTLDTQGNSATLSGIDNEVIASSITFQQIESVDLASDTVKGTLNGTDVSDEFEINGANALTSDNVKFTGVGSVAAGSSNDDSITSTLAVDATLSAANKALMVAGINFTAIDSANVSQGIVTGTDSSETFEISNTNNAVTVNGMSLTAVSAVNAGSSMDDVVKVATGVQATADLTAVDNQILASAITFNDVDTVNLGGGTLNGSNSENEVYVVNTTANALAVKNMQFESVNAVNGGADSIDSIATLGVAVDAQLTGADKQLLVSDITFSDISSANMSGGRLSGSDEADTIQLTSAGMAANEINFYLINSAVDTQGGDDTVIGRAGVDWTLTGTNGEINSVRYQFKNVENVDVVSEGVTGAATAETFELGTEESQVIVNQLTLSNVSTVTADLNDTLLGTSGDDVFNVNSDTSVITNSTTFDGMENLNGGEGQDTLISNVDGLAWIINQASDGVNSLGDFLFSQFEVLNNNVGNLNFSTSIQTVFAGESLTSSDMTLNFNGQEDVIINSTYVGKNAITGNLIAHLADINASGDIDLDTEIDILNVSTNDNRSINATFVQNSDLVLRTVDVGDSGTVILDSALEGTGLLTTETRNGVNFVAKSVSIGTGKSDRQGAGLWEGVGSSADASQLTFDVSFNLDLEALYYVTPFFPNGAPITSQLEGIESDSLISSQQSALIVTDTVQNLAQLDPAIFESLTPYIADANSIAGADNYYASSEVPSTLDTAQLAALLSSYEPTAAGGVNYDEYKLDGESEENDEKKKLAKKLSKAGTFVADDNSDIKVAYSESGEMLGVVKDYVFQAGDSLWSLSKRYLGNGFAWTEIAKQNPSIKNPSSIADGQIIKVVVKVSDEIGQILKSAISAGGISKEGNSATLPASLRREVALP